MIAPATRAQGGRHTHRPSIAHAEDPKRPGRALCGAKLRGHPAGAHSDRCVVCLDLARRSFVGR